MASNLIITFQTKADATGANQIGKGMEDMKRRMQETASATDDVAKSFSTLKNIIVGTVLALPLTGFIKEAIASEEVTARFGIQLKTLGQNINTLDIEGITQRLHQFGITQTEVIEAFSRGLPYFKNTENELKYLNTAIGMTRYSGVELSTAFQQLGYIMQYGNARVARQYGVAMHSEIREPTQRAAAVMADLQKAMEPLATTTGTTAESLKAMAAIIKDTGEKIGAEFLRPIAAMAEAFNKLSPEMQTMIIRTVLFTTAVGGLALAFSALGKAMAGSAILSSLSGLQGIFALPFVSNIGKLQMAIQGLAGAFGGLIIGGATIGAILAIQDAAAKVKDSFANAEKAEAAYFSTVMNAMHARASDATTAIGNEEKFTDKVKETEKVYKNLLTQQALFRMHGEAGKAGEEQAAKQAAQVKALLDSQQKEAAEMAKHNISTLEDYKKFQYKMAELRVQSIKGSSERELAEFRLKWQKERDEMLKAYGDQMDVRLALTKAEAAQEIDVRKKQLDKELEYASMTNEERKKYDQDYQNAKSQLAGMSFEGFKTADDSLKELVKTSGGAKALDEQKTAWAEQQVQIAQTKKELELYGATAADIAQLYQKNKDKGIEWLKREEQAIKDKKRAELEEAETGVKSLKSFTSEEKTISAKAEMNINTTVNITPNLSEIGKAAGDAVAAAVNNNTKQIEDAVKQRLQG
jgi:hypothetical protein